MGGEVGRGVDWEFGISRCKLQDTGWINNKVLLCITGSCIPCPVINHHRNEYEKACKNFFKATVPRWCAMGRKVLF